MLRKMKAARWLGIGIIVGAVAVGAAGAQAADKFDDRPFSGAATGTSSATFGMPGTVTGVGAGTLNATHIGNAEYVLNTNQDYPRHMESNIDHATGQCAFIEDGEDGDGTPGLVITAANGDSINGYVDDDRSVTCAPEDQSPAGAQVGDVYQSTVYITVIGGTGRFEDASGWLFSEGESTITNVDVPTLTASADDVSTILGDIDY
jgi:hypothetical protein